ncbi:MAG: hypothetical protein KY455_12910 [Euryarchaeota archaeon]|nr:hypothetical protein [Euryarchaeota archaeon]
MRPSLLFALVGLSLLFAALPSGDAALPQQTVVAGPGAWLTTYATPAVAVEQGGSLSFTNSDLLHHDVVSREKGVDDAPWCSGYATGDCPLFWSPLIGLGETTPVVGLEETTPGTAYTYYCTLHPNMTGTLVALERRD